MKCDNLSRTVTIGIIFWAAIFGLQFISPWFSNVVSSEETKTNIDLSTGDGLTVRLAPAFGVILDKEALPTTDYSGGLLLRDLRFGPGVNLFQNPGFEEGINGWTIGSGYGIDSSIIHTGQKSLRLQTLGSEPMRSGSLLSIPIPVKPKTEYIFSMWVRVEEARPWVAYIIQTDDSGNKTTADLQIGLQFSDKANFDWNQLQTVFQTDLKTTRIQIYCKIWASKGVLWVDDIFLSEKSTVKEIPVKGTLSETEGQVVQSAELKDIGLRFNVAYRNGVGKIEVEGEVSDTTGKDRALQVGFRIPVNFMGWSWEEGLRTSQKIEPNKSYYNWFELGKDRQCNHLPFSAVTGKQIGLGLGIPMDAPRVFRISYEPEGFEIWFDLGLSQETKFFPSKASFTFVLYTYPAKWGLRAATQKYYDIYPHFFERRTERAGNWNYYVDFRGLGVRNPEDFSLRFSGTHTSWNNQHSIYTHVYTEAWGWWMPWGQVKNRGEKLPQPSYDELLSKLKQARQASPEEKGGFTLPTISLPEIALAIYNSGIHDEQGKFVFPGDYSWNTLGSDTWVQHCPVNPDPDIQPLPNIGTLTRKLRMEPWFSDADKLGVRLDGVYVDSVVTHWVGSLENYRRSHWQVSNHPLVFNPVTGAVCQLNLFGMYDFISELSTEMHSNGKILHANCFPYAHTFFAHLLDILGHEGTIDEVKNLEKSNDDGLNYIHILSGKKPISFYDYDWWHKSFNQAEKERRLLKCMFYGIFPGLPWDGDEVTEASEILRPLCRKYLPVIEQLAEAGWEPITGAVASKPYVKVERYGDGKNKNLNFTVRNDSNEQQLFTLTIYPGEVGLVPVPGDLIAINLVSNEMIQFQHVDSQILLNLRLNPGETRAIGFGTPIQFVQSHLQITAERLSMIKDISQFNTKRTPFIHSIDLRPGWYIDKRNSSGSYSIQEDSALLDRGGRPTICMSNSSNGDKGIYYPGDVWVRPGEEYELIIYYQNQSPHSPGQELKNLSIRVGFIDCFHYLMEDKWETLKPMIAVPSGQWGLYQTRVIVPPQGVRMFFSFILNGNDTTIWLGDQVITRSDKTDIALSELNQIEPVDGWLARQVLPRLAGLTQQMTRTSSTPTVELLQDLQIGLVELKNELSKRYPPSSQWRNAEVWQRLNDALTHLKIAHELLLYMR